VSRRPDHARESGGFTESLSHVTHDGKIPLKSKTTGQYLRDVGLVVDGDGWHAFYAFRDTKPDAFPALESVWDTVGSLDKGAAQEQLLRKSREESRSAEAEFSISGLRIKSTAAIVLAPAVVFFLQLYLLVHVMHLRKIATSEYVPELRSFPFLPILSSGLSTF
jgi:hypothetical protein